MLDIKFVRDNPDAVKENIKKKFQDAKLPLVDEVIEKDAKYRECLKEVESLKAARNKLSKANGPLFGQLKKCDDEAKKAELQKELFEKIKEGDIVEGVVKNVTDFGAFIDLGGADGLLHISEMSWGRVEHPKKVFKVGDKLKVLIKEINGNKIALSLKFDDANPWKNAAEKYAVGNVVTGKVARMTDFGAFVELEPGVDALLHVSQIAKEHIEKPSDVLSVGDEVRAKVVDFNEADHKISLSVKALTAPETVEAEEESDADVVSVDIDAVIAAEAENSEK